MSEDLDAIIDLMQDLSEDPTVPRNIKNKILELIETLKEDVELSIKINKVLSELDEISDDSNLQAFTRTQLWNIVSMLEKLH
ncbi:UPF0147 family protein [Candidatus Woesearchaeota archaeon]|nr:UPF0147 family protein [Candidatus Woesearchaeota archaeon]